MKIGIAKKREMTKRALVEMELKSIRSQMNPHFLFNALSAIQNLIHKNDTEKANHYLTQFAQLMRLTLDKSEKGVVPLEDELKSIQKYLELEKLRFFFNYKIEIDASVDVYQTEIPAMLIQPYVENAIIHGLKEIEGEKHLILKFKIIKDSLLSIVEDNGIGIKKATQKKKSLGVERAPYGLKLAEDRIQLIKDSYKTDVEIKIVDLSTEDSKLTGTRVEIRLPLKY
jgi:LytS/YehU family sensor histidine kinase